MFDACAETNSTVSVSVRCPTTRFAAGMRRVEYTSQWQPAVGQFQCVRMEIDMLQYGSYNKTGDLQYDWTVLAAPIGSLYEPITLPTKRSLLWFDIIGDSTRYTANTTNTTTYKATLQYTVKNSTVQLTSLVDGMASLVPDKPGVYSGESKEGE